MERWIEFESDSNKAASNIEKHGIDFDDAVKVFSDPRVRITEVTKPEHGETRFKAVRLVDDLDIAVIFTNRGAARRIISARRSGTK